MIAPLIFAIVQVIMIVNSIAFTMAALRHSACVTAIVCFHFSVKNKTLTPCRYNIAQELTFQFVCKVIKTFLFYVVNIRN